MKWIKLFEFFTLNEGRYDKISNQISSSVFRKWKEDFNEGETNCIFEDTFESNEIEVEVVATLVITPGIEKLKVDGGVHEETAYLQIDFEIDPNLLPSFWEEISMNLKDVVRHEIEHLTHSDGYNLNPNKEMPDDDLIRNLITAELLPPSAYFKLMKEVDANLQGMYFRAKKEKRPFRSVIDSYLDSQPISKSDKEEILDLWRGRLKSLNLPKF
jgi:hypothetical protein